MRARRLALLAVLLGLAGCGGGGSSDTGAGGPTLDSAKIEKALKSATEVTGPVVCPDRVPKRKGIRFHCRASTSGGSGTLTLTQKDGAGNLFNYRGRVGRYVFAARTNTLNVRLALLFKH